MDEAGSSRDDAEALALCQASMAAFNARDIDAMLERFDPEVEWWPLRSETEGAFRGHDGIRKWVDETAELFEHSRAQIDAARWIGDDAVLAEGRIDLQGKASGAPIELPVTWVFRLRDDKVVWGRAFNDRRRRSPSSRPTEQLSASRSVEEVGGTVAGDWHGGDRGGDLDRRRHPGELARARGPRGGGRAAHPLHARGRGRRQAAEPGRQGRLGGRSASTASATTSRPSPGAAATACRRRSSARG